jgi:hypothetical protein
MVSLGWFWVTEGVTNRRRSFWRDRRFRLGGGILLVLFAGCFPASRNHSSDCARAEPGQFNGSVDGDRYRPVGRLGRWIFAERPQNAVIQNKHAAADHPGLEGGPLS